MGGEEVKAAVIPESVLKKRKRAKEWALAKKKEVEERKKKSAENRRVIFTRALQYAKEYESQEKELIQLKREARLKGGFYVSPEAKLLFIIRIRVYTGLPYQRHASKNSKNFAAPPSPSDIQWCISESEQGYNEYVTQGRTLCHIWVPQSEKCSGVDLYKRGYGKLNKQRIALTDNSVVEQALGKYGIICVEDLIHEIMTVGSHFKEANNFLWPFKLKAPLGGLKKKRNHYVEGGDSGNRENYINELIRRMN